MKERINWQQIENEINSLGEGIGGVSNGGGGGTIGAPGVGPASGNGGSGGWSGLGNWSNTGTGATINPPPPNNPGANTNPIPDYQCKKAQLQVFKDEYGINLEQEFPDIAYDCFFESSCSTPQANEDCALNAIEMACRMSKLQAFKAEYAINLLEEYPDIAEECMLNSPCSNGNSANCALEKLMELWEDQIIEIQPTIPIVTANNPMCSQMFTFQPDLTNPSKRHAGISDLRISLNLNSGLRSFQFPNMYFAAEPINNCPLTLADFASTAINNGMANAITRINNGQISGDKRLGIFIEIRKAFRSASAICAPHNTPTPFNAVTLPDGNQKQVYISQGAIFANFSQFNQICD